jgi:transcription-repair coupling factor (superfamily II helicase)
VAERLKKLVPNVRIGVAHGQLPERVLEQVVIGFWNREFDLLLCTTIVESGIDIPNANTLIVDNADKFGLAQLHQLRGRVGRSRERAYAYFFYPAEKPLTELAHDRLKTIATNTDLGAGMQVALKDLEIRGAGNLLGGEQSGHIAQVGFDLYMKMVSEAVSDFKFEYLKGFGANRSNKNPLSKSKNENLENLDESEECRLEIPVNANIPDSYIESQRLRLDIYRRLAAAREDVELESIADELRDRFGQLPANLNLLLLACQIKNSARRIGIREILWGNGKLRISPTFLPDGLAQKYPGLNYKPATKLLVIPYSDSEFGESELNLATFDSNLLNWINSLISSLTTLAHSTAK